MTPVEKYNAAVKEYLDNCRMVELSENTVTNYARCLGYFGDFWSQRYDDDSPKQDPTAADVKAWRDRMKRNGLKVTTIKRYLADLGIFFSFLSDGVFGKELTYTENPVNKRLYPVTKKAERRPYDTLLTNEQVCALYENRCPTAQAKPQWARNYAIVILLLTSGIRNAELLDLTPADIDFEEKELTVMHGKGDKFRICDLDDLAVSALEIYLNSGIRPQSAGMDEPLFGTTAGHEMGTRRSGEQWHRGTSQWLSSLVERHVKSVTGVSDIRTHDLRHVCARIDLNSGALGLEALQSKLGHESVNTTQIYSGKLRERHQRENAREVFHWRQEQAQRNFEQLGA